jgi:hypothetical protein
VLKIPPACSCEPLNEIKKIKKMTQDQLNSKLLQNSIENKASLRNLMYENAILKAMLKNIFIKLDIPLEQFQIPESEEFDIPKFVESEISKLNLL